MKKKQVYAYLHTHWDREWYRDKEDFNLRLLDVFDIVIDELLNARAPFFYLDGQVIALLDYLKFRKNKFHKRNKGFYKKNILKFQKSDTYKKYQILNIINSILKDNFIIEAVFIPIYAFPYIDNSCLKKTSFLVVNKSKFFDLLR